MKLIVKCSNCNSANNAPKMNDRISYAKNKGENFSITCSSCNETNEYHVDDIKAIDYSFTEIIKNRLVVFAIIFVAVAITGYFFIGVARSLAASFIATIISMVFAKQNNSSKNLTFNKHKLKGRVSSIGFRK